MLVLRERESFRMFKIMRGYERFLYVINLIPPNEKIHCSVFFKRKHGINLRNHVAQWGAVNKKSNVSTISYYIDE